MEVIINYEEETIKMYKMGGRSFGELINSICWLRSKLHESMRSDILFTNDEYKKVFSEYFDQKINALRDDLLKQMNDNCEFDYNKDYDRLLKKLYDIIRKIRHRFMILQKLEQLESNNKES